MPQRNTLVTNNMQPFSSSYFPGPWPANRSRPSTTQGIQSAGVLPSKHRAKGDSFDDNDIKTLDYLGLDDSTHSKGAVETPISNPLVAQLAALNDLKKSANRFRSYSVNAKERYNDDNDDEDMPLEDSSALFSGAASQYTGVQAAALQAAVRQHNIDVQVFSQLANANRPRARTAGMLDSPNNRSSRVYMPTPSRLDNSMSAADFTPQAFMPPDTLANQLSQLHFDPHASHEVPDDMINETPSRALWLGNIPSSTTVSSLNSIFGQFGHIESARVLTHKSCGFVNFDSIESAVLAKSQLCNKELFPGAGPIRIGYAKVLGDTNSSTTNAGTPRVNATANKIVASHSQSNLSLQTSEINAATAAAALQTPKITDHREELQDIVRKLGANKDDQARIAAKVEQAIGYDLYRSEMPVPEEPSQTRIHDASKLRDIRKRIDSNTCSTAEIEDIAAEMLSEIAELSSDYLGNTVVQKLFETCSEQMKDTMLEAIAPTLAEIGMHKNGTWAAQKIIDVAQTPTQMSLIVDSLRPYAVQLFLDQYGNYVMQCCLRFGAPMTDFIFDVMLNRMWEVSQGRFGARAMRACLESHFATKDQQRMLAAAVALHGVQLATNANGALLLTWLLDTCTFPNRRAVLAPRLKAHLVHLCTHKVAYMTVLKVINQRTEPEARDIILDALFSDADSTVLSDILSDQACGATFVYKVLSTPFLDEHRRLAMVERIRDVLVELDAQPQSGYKRLMEEIGMSTGHGVHTDPASSRDRSVSRGRAPGGYAVRRDDHQAFPDYQYANMISQQGIDLSQMQRLSNLDTGAVDVFVPSPQAYTHSPSTPGMQNAMHPQMHHQQQRGNGYMHSPSAGYRSAPPTIDAYGRPASMSGSPGAGSPMGMLGYQQPMYNPMMNMNTYAYQSGYFPQQQQQQQHQHQGHQVNGGRKNKVGNAAR